MSSLCIIGFPLFSDLNSNQSPDIITSSLQFQAFESIIFSQNQRLTNQVRAWGETQET